MTNAHSPADDLVYDLVSIQYHALKGAELADRFRRDAEGHDDVIAFLERVVQEDARRAEECHRLLRMLTRDHGIGGPSSHEPGMGQGSFAMGSGDDGLAAGATSDEACAGDVTGGGGTTGLSDYAPGDGSGPTTAEDAPPIAEDDQDDRGRRSVGGEGEGSGGAEGASGDSADGTGYLEARGPGAQTDDVEGAAANAASGAATTDEPGSVDLRGTSDPAAPRT
ncbi:MAG: hypothetical protein U0R76_13445 [Candidatus Nanopelagicales bacterium]